MATPLLPLNFLSQPPFPYSSSSSSSSSSQHLYLVPYSQTLYLNSFRSSRLKLFCSVQTVEIDTQQNSPTKKRRKPRPSFLEQVQEKWSRKTNLVIDKLPWEEQQAEEGEGEEEDCEIFFQEVEVQNVPYSNLISPQSASSEKRSALIQPVSSSLPEKVILAPWEHGNKHRKKSQLDYEARNSKKAIQNAGNLSEFHEHSENIIAGSVVKDVKDLEEKFNLDEEIGEKGVKNDDTPIGLSKKDEILLIEADGGEETENNEEENFRHFLHEKGVKDDDTPIGLSKKDEILLIEADGGEETENNEVGNFRHFLHEKGSKDASNSVMLPWESENDRPIDEGKRLRKGNTEMAERLIPEPELKRLRNVAVRMVERIKVGAAGVTQALLDSIREKWKADEVVKLKFEGPTAMNMRWTHEILERRTGGLVIWRSGSSIVLYRGMAYKLDCVQSYTKQAQENAKEFESSGALANNVTQRIGSNNSTGVAEPSITESLKYLNNLSSKELKDLTELNLLLDELGPRFKDWSGREPLPVDADLLPAVVPGYRPPFRLLPYGVRQGLRDKEMTYLRRTARLLPPHFALGRNRELQGLAMAMVKLWEKSAIAKIAIKRGVLNTRNERMAEELKVLTGGTLLSRNKEYVVFYRGNDFLPSGVTQALMETKKRISFQQDEEEKARQRALVLIDSNTKIAKGPLVAGTLSETKAAFSRWGNQPSNEDLEKMMRDSAVARHDSLVKFLEKKLATAKGKITKAEKGLWKVQENLKPNELPTDLETITDEERFLFRKIGLSMKPYLVLGRRGIFDGIIENMHLHWKYRELVKIIVERKSFPLVKHIAISLEAESGGVLVSVDKTTKGYAIIVYRGKNYDRPTACRPKNLLTRRQALARAIELQRREALKHHVSELREKIVELKSELEDMKSVEEIDEETFSSRVDYASDDDEDLQEDEGEEEYLETYDDNSGEDENS